MPTPEDLADNIRRRQFDFSIPVAPTCHVVAFVRRWKIREGGSVFQPSSFSEYISTIQRLYFWLKLRAVEAIERCYFGSVAAV